MDTNLNYLERGKKLSSSSRQIYERGWWAAPILSKLELNVLVDPPHNYIIINLYVPLYKTFSGQRTFAYRAVSLWNSLDEGLQSSTSVKAFKCSLKTSMLNERDNL